MKTHFLSLFAAMMVALVSTSCIKDDDVTVTSTVTRNYSECFNTVFDNTNGSVIIDDNAKYSLEIKSYSDGTMAGKLKVTGLYIDPSISHRDFEFDDMTINQDSKGYYIMEGTNVVPSNLSGAAGINFTKVRFTMLDVMESVNMGTAVTIRTVYSASFVVNNRFDINAYALTNYLYGTTKTVDAAGSEYQTGATRYVLVFDPVKKTARIDITGAQFIQQMPALNMTFPDIPFTADAATLTLKSPNFIPTIANVPQESFAISNLDGTFNPQNGALLLDFYCNPMNMGLYKATINVSPYPVK